MNKDFIRYIMTSEKIKNNKRIKISFQREKQYFKIIENNSESEKEQKIIKENTNTDNVNKISFSNYNKESDFDMEKSDEKIIQVMKNLSLHNIIKSFFCCKDKKLKLINLIN